MWAKTTIFWKASKMTKNSQKLFLVFLVTFFVRFASKWCAAISSAVSLGGPEGQVFKFNANLWLQNITASYVHFSERYSQNGYLRWVPVYLKLQIRTSNVSKSWNLDLKLSGFWVHMWAKMTIFWKHPKWPKTFKSYFQWRFSYVLLVNDAQHSPPLCLHSLSSPCQRPSCYLFFWVPYVVLAWNPVVFVAVAHYYHHHSYDYCC